MRQMTVTSIDQGATLASRVAERPARAEVFERLQLDYRLDADRLPLGSAGDRDWRGAGIGELCDHLVSVHHEGLGRELPRISELLAKVARVHGEKSPALARMEQRFSGLCHRPLSHIELEERAWFPACRALEGEEGATAVGEEPIARHEVDHSGVGDELFAMRELAGGYDASTAFCGTHRALLDALRELESDLHQHIHEENNVLFPRVRRLAGAGEILGTDSRREA
jgi:regulator of cell morphogenesis and NO signaling